MTVFIHIDEKSQESLDQKFQSINTYNDLVFEYTMLSEIINNQENEDYEMNKMMIDSGVGNHMTYQYKRLSYVKALDNQVMIKCADRNALMFGTHLSDIFCAEIEMTQQK